MIRFLQNVFGSGKTATATEELPTQDPVEHEPPVPKLLSGFSKPIEQMTDDECKTVAGSMGYLIQVEKNFEHSLYRPLWAKDDRSETLSHAPGLILGLDCLGISWSKGNYCGNADEAIRLALEHVARLEGRLKEVKVIDQGGLREFVKLSKYA